MKLQGISLVQPFVDLRPLVAPTSRLFYLSPLLTRTAKTYLRGFGLAQERLTRIPFRKDETIGFNCRGAVTLPPTLPGGGNVSMVVRRLYLDTGAAARLDLSLFGDRKHLSGDPVTDPFRTYWNASFQVHGQLPAVRLLPELTETLRGLYATASSTETSHREDLVRCAPPLMIAFMERASGELPRGSTPLDKDGILFAAVNYRSMPRTPSKVACALVTYPARSVVPFADYPFDQLRHARLLPAWLHTDVQILMALAQRATSVPSETTAILQAIEGLCQGLLTLLTKDDAGDLSIQPFLPLCRAPITRLRPLLRSLGLHTLADELGRALLSDRSTSKSSTATAAPGPTPSPTPVSTKTTSPLDQYIITALETYQAALAPTPQRPRSQRYDDAVFQHSATDKAAEVLRRLALHRVLPVPPVIVSIGGADGSELFALLEATGSRRGVLLDSADPAILAARERATREKYDVRTFTGDVTQKLSAVMNSARELAEKDHSPILVTTMAVLHELPTRSPGFDLLGFFGQFSDATFVIGREPVEPAGWEGPVLLQGEFTPDLFVTLANRVIHGAYIAAKGQPAIKTERIGQRAVRGPGGLLFETLLKAFYSDALLYELEECNTYYRGETLLQTLKTALNPTHTVYGQHITSPSIDRLWRRCSLDAEAPPGTQRGIPHSHYWYEAVRRDHSAPIETSKERT